MGTYHLDLEPDVTPVTGSGCAAGYNAIFPHSGFDPCFKNAR